MNDSTTAEYYAAAPDRAHRAFVLVSEESYRYDRAIMDGRADSTIARKLRNLEKAQKALRSAQTALGLAHIADMEAEAATIVEQPMPEPQSSHCGTCGRKTGEAWDGCPDCAPAGSEVVQPMAEQQQASAQAPEALETQQQAQVVAQHEARRAYKPSKRERMALAALELERLDAEAEEAFQAEMQARREEEDAAHARTLATFELTAIVVDRATTAPGAWIRPCYADTPGAQVAEWKAANAALRGVMAKAAMGEENRIKGAGKYLNLKHLYTFRQLQPDELHALRLAILGGYLTQDWELAGQGESAMDWEALSTVDDDDFARIAD